MFGPTTYVPMLLTKRAECLALHDLSWSAKQRVTPMFVVSPVAWSYDLDGPATTAAAHLASLPSQLAEAWAGGRAFIDARFVGEDQRLRDGTPALSWLVDQAGALGVTLVPVTGPYRPAPVDDIVAELATWDDRGLCLRLMPTEWPTRTGPTEFRRMIDRLQVDPSHIDLVLDLGDVADVEEDAVTSAVLYELAVLPFPHAWRSLTVAGSSVPMAHPAGVRRVQRHEWNVHRRLAKERELPRRPAFGDYGVAHPDPRTEIDAVGPSREITLRHTVGDQLMLARGQPPDLGHGAGVDARTVPGAALWIRSNLGFEPGHCGLEDALVAVATRRAPPGTPSYWRRLATRHHIEVVVDQLRALSGRIEEDERVGAMPERRRSAG